ncbi:hypothetical protein A7W90_00615 [Clostridium sp. Bc-iso-3]|nr:hypothetical protein A7W90_00615 [Clostridium sp. Bc-iso-3]
MEEIYNKVLFNQVVFTAIADIIVLVGCIVLWFASDVIKIKKKGVVVREIKMKKGVRIIVNRLLPLLVLCIIAPYTINLSLDYAKKDYLYGEGKITSYYNNMRTGIAMHIDDVYYDLPKTYRANISLNNRDITYKFTYARRTKLILHIEAVDNEGFDNEAMD